MTFKEYVLLYRHLSFGSILFLTTAVDFCFSNLFSLPLTFSFLTFFALRVLVVS